MKRLPFLFFFAFGILAVVRGSDPGATERIREGEAKQQQLRGDAERIVEQLDSMIDEYQRNRLGGDDLRTLQTLRNSLAHLSVDEMKRVLDLLEKARATQNSGEAKQRVADAYTSQKAILAEMTKLLADHVRNQEGQEISQHLGKLAERQAVNLRNAISLGQWTDGRKPDNFEAATEANLQGQQAEQAAIADELKAVAQQVATFAKDPENAEQARRFQKGLEAIQKVQPNVDNAATALKSGQLFKAVNSEKMARDSMRQLARDIAPPPERADTLRAAERELSRTIEDQKELVKDTAKAAGEKDLERWLDQQQQQNPRLAKVPREQLRQDPKLRQQFNAQRNGQPEEIPKMESKQGELAARTDEVAQALAKAAPEAARGVKAGTERMQEARLAMSDKNGTAAAKTTELALTALQAAEANLQQEIAKAEALAGKSGDPAKNLQALGQQAQQLAQEQAEAAKNSNKLGQPALTQKVNEFAQQAAAMSPAAAPAAQQAAANAQQAAQAAQADQAGAASQAQQAAAQDLAQVAQQIAQQAAAAQQAEQKMAAEENAERRLADLVLAEQKLEIDTTKRVALAAKEKTVKRDAFQTQASRQGEIGAQTADFEKSVADLAADAKTAIDSAQTAMNDARQALEKPDGESGLAAEKKAIEDLSAAMKAAQAAEAQQQQALGQEPGAQAEAAAKEAATELAQAQAEVAQANQALQNATQAAQSGQGAAAQKAEAQAAAALTKAAEAAEKAAAQPMPQNEAAQQALQNGAQAAAQAAGQAAAQNVPAAQEQAAAAQQALAQAQTAMAQAQAGLTAANNAGDLPSMPGGQPGQPGRSGQPGQPGQKPGNTPGGKTPGQAPGKSTGQPSTQGAQQYLPPSGNETARVETRQAGNAKSTFAGLPPRERAVIEQAQSEKYPQEYGTQVEQYLLNLARESSAKK
jgi:hypothetical protein